MEEEKVNTKPPKSRVMVVDDEKTMLDFMNFALAKSYKVKPVQQAALAVSTAQEFQPDLVILDLNMPNIDGYEILSQFKKHPTLSSIPILCISGDTSPEVRQRTDKLGAAGFLAKPVKLKQLRTDIEQLVRNSNIEVRSEDLRRGFFIACNSHEKEKAIHSQIEKWSSEDVPTLMLTLANGSRFCNERENDLVLQEHFFYLQFKGSILAKLPYMDDLSLFLYDIDDLFGRKTSGWNLILDDPDIVVNIYDRSSSMGHMVMFSELIDRNFSNIMYYCKKPVSEVYSEDINRLANLFTGQL